MNSIFKKFDFSKSRQKDLFVIVALYIIGLIAVALIKPTYLINILIVYLPGLLYTFCKLQRSRKKVLLFGLASIIFIIPVEILARSTDSWDVASNFPRILGIAPVENIVYALVNIVYPLTFYKLFYNTDKSSKISPRWKYLIIIYLLISIAIFLNYFLARNILQFDYWMIGLIIILPLLAILLIYKKHIFKRLIIPAVLFGLMYFIHEIISMCIGHWWWPGQYLLPVNLFGHLYPLEDFIIWILFSNIAVITGYEVFWD